MLKFTQNPDTWSVSDEQLPVGRLQKIEGKMVFFPAEHVYLTEGDLHWIGRVIHDICHLSQGVDNVDQS